jgi:hypothetical protein
MPLNTLNSENNNRFTGWVAVIDEVMWKVWSRVAWLGNRKTPHEEIQIPIAKEITVWRWTWFYVFEEGDLQDDKKEPSWSTYVKDGQLQVFHLDHEKDADKPFYEIKTLLSLIQTLGTLLVHEKSPISMTKFILQELKKHGISIEKQKPNWRGSITYRLSKKQ